MQYIAYNQVGSRTLYIYTIGSGFITYGWGTGPKQVAQLYYATNRYGKIGKVSFTFYEPDSIIGQGMCLWNCAGNPDSATEPIHLWLEKLEKDIKYQVNHLKRLAA